MQVTLSRIGNHCVVDPTPEEEACSASSLVMGVTPEGRVTTLRKMGSGSFHQQTLAAAVDLGSYFDLNSIFKTNPKLSNK
jgi:exosome complex component RRP42